MVAHADLSSGVTKCRAIVRISRVPGKVCAPGDYVSPGLEVILPDAAFPNIVLGDRRQNTWPYLRREIPHNWYVDSTAASIGFVTRDEASILYNYARQFAGRRALEIGCWRGWSACHLALGGVELDVIDPVLSQAEFVKTVTDSLNAAGVGRQCNLIGGYSPEEVHRLGRAGRRWSLIFIDGNHEAPGPVNDAIAVAPYAEADAAILFSRSGGAGGGRRGCGIYAMRGGIRWCI